MTSSGKLMKERLKAGTVCSKYIIGTLPFRNYATISPRICIIQH